jgi:hypothetical protein
MNTLKKNIFNYSHFLIISSKNIVIKCIFSENYWRQSTLGARLKGQDEAGAGFQIEITALTRPPYFLKRRPEPQVPQFYPVI